MSYLPQQGALGGITDVLTAAQSVVTDPCLLQVAQQVGRLHELEQSPLLPGGTPGPVTAVQGIGLCKAVTPLNVVIWVRERPWVVPLGAAALIGGLVGIGYLIGSGKKRSGTSTKLVTNGRRVNPSRRGRR